MRPIDADNLLTAFPAGENETFRTSAVRGTINACPTLEVIPYQWLLNYIDALPEDTPSQVLSRLALINMGAAWQKEQASRTNELG